MYVVAKKQNPKTKTSVRINSVNVDFIVEKGTTVDVIDSQTYDRLKSNVTLSRSTKKIFTYACDKPLPLKGQFQALFESNTRHTVSQVYVVEGSAGNLLSAQTAQDLELIHLVNKVTEFNELPPSPENGQTNAPGTKPMCLPPTANPASHTLPKCSDLYIQKIIEQHRIVFMGEGKLNTQQVKLHINKKIKPFCPTTAQNTISYAKRSIKN